jgi:formylglycine-generating enzyme required for sulfatase activity
MIKKGLGDYAGYHKKTDSLDEQYVKQIDLRKSNAFGLYDMHGNVW